MTEGYRTSTWGRLAGAWQWLMKPRTIAEWHWSGERLRDLPVAAFHDFVRWIRTPILRFLALNDLIIIGDVYGSNGEPAVVQVPSGLTAEIIGSISVWDGPATVMPRGCLPKKPIRAVKSGSWNDPASWMRV